MDGQPEQPGEIVPDWRAELTRLRAELAGRSGVDAHQTQALIETMLLRLDELELGIECIELGARHALVPAREPRPARVRAPRLRYQAGRIRALGRPRLGRLWHYPARPLLVPASYLRSVPPSPAPSISIVTPTFNHGHFIERTLSSVIGQGYPELEYFVQDGGSTDGTPEILQGWEGRLTGWRSEPDDGQADAINRAFARTSGEIMAWLNSDDLLLPGSLAYVARYFAEHPNVDVVYGNRLMIDDADGQIGAWILPQHDRTALTLADFIPQETLFWRRRTWEAAGGHVDPSFAYAMDWELLLRLQDSGARMRRLPRFLGAFRIHSEQKTSAHEVVGVSEMERLRERIHGRPVSVHEVNQRLRPYYRRHVALHLKQRVLDRLPLARVPVETAPVRASLTAATTPIEPPALGATPGKSESSPGSPIPQDWAPQQD